MTGAPQKDFKVAAIAVRKVFRRADNADLLVLDSVSIRVNVGEIVCLLGPSGCGKTTLLKILAGLDSDYEGQVKVAPPEAAPLRVGYMPQTDALLPWRTAFSNIRLGLEFQHVPKETADARVCEALSLVALEEFRFAYPLQLSGGMRQRVALARALAVEPQLLLMDEPLAHLDFVLRRRLAAMLKQRVQQSACAAVVATHSIEEAVMMANRVIVLSARPARVQAVLRLANGGTDLSETGAQTCSSVGEMFDRIAQAFSDNAEGTT